MRYKAIKRISELSINYRALFEKNSVSYQREPNHINISNNWWLSLSSFFDRVFFQGRNDTLSGRYERATIKALESFFGDTGIEKIKQLEHDEWLDWKNYGYYLQKDDSNLIPATPRNGCYSKTLYECLKNNYEITHEGVQITHDTGKTRDKAMVISTLKFISKLKDLNILKYSIAKIKANKLYDLEKELIKKIHQVGEKTCSLFLRDTVAFYNLEKYLCQKDYDILQPIDTWVHQMAIKLNLIENDMKIINLKNNRNILTEAAIDAGVSPIEFNQGLWYLPTHAVALLLDEYRK